MRKFIYFLFGCMAGLLSCAQERIAPELQMHVDNFYEEASNRGISITHRGMIAELGDIDEAGLGGPTYLGRPKIIINRNMYENYKDSTYPIEALVFHEMGHAVLGRGHIDYNVGDKRSIMNPSVCLTCYTEETRDKMIDDLFYNN